jgi:hypothetical protein
MQTIFYFLLDRCHADYVLFFWAANFPKIDVLGRKVVLAGTLDKRTKTKLLGRQWYIPVPEKKMKIERKK